MVEIRCKKCNKLLFIAEGNFDVINIKCTRCKTFLLLSRKSSDIIVIESSLESPEDQRITK